MITPKGYYMKQMKEKILVASRLRAGSGRAHAAQPRGSRGFDTGHTLHVYT